MLALASQRRQSQSGTYTVRLMTPETALKATRAALEECRKRGFQVSVAVVDRAGVAQALMRDRFAGPHTVQTAINKGWTAISFRTDTLEFAQADASGQREFRRPCDLEGRGGRRRREHRRGRQHGWRDRRFGRTDR